LVAVRQRKAHTDECQIYTWRLAQTHLSFFGEYDIDILIEKRDVGLDELRGEIIRKDRRFAEAGVRLYYVQVCWFFIS
jgi:hypothetical protein